MTRHVWSDPDSFVKTPAMAVAVLRDLELPRIDRYLDEIAERGGVDLDALRRLSANTLVAMSGEAHLKVRRVIAPFFSQSGLAPWRPLMKEACHSVCEELKTARDPDLVRDVTIPLFLKVMPQILGLDMPPTREHFQAAETAQRLTEPYLSLPTLKALNRAASLLVSTCPKTGEGEGSAPESLLAYLRRRKGDLPDGLEPEYFVVGLLVGSNSATQSLAFALYGLLSGPAQLWADAGGPGWGAQETQRLLGLYQSTRTLVRVANEARDVAGCPYHQGQSAVVDIVAANACLRADSLRADRGTRQSHMSFGSGAHRCPGVFLSEMLIETAIPILARTFPDITLKTDEGRFVVTPMMQAPTALPCSIGKTSRRVSARLCDIRDMGSAHRILKDNDAFAPPPMESHLTLLSQASGEDLGEATRIARNALFFMDGARHEALKQVLMRFLGAAQLAPWRGVVDAALDTALQELSATTRPDLVSGYADPLRRSIMTRILGISCQDPQRFDAIAPHLQDVLEPWLSMRKLRRVQAVFTEALSLMQVPAASDGPPSLLEHLVADAPAGFDEADLKAVVLVLYGASFNLSHTLSNALLSILSQPAEERSAASGQAWVEANIDELVARCSGPKFIYRVARTDLSLGDLAMKAGDTARLNVHVLNRQAPAGKGHVSFGKGLHRCVGATLSVMVLKQAIPAIFRRFPNLALDVQAHRYRPMSETVALSTLPCIFSRTEPNHD